MDVNAGVPQGSILGPLLFIIFTNSMSSVIKHGNIFMYVDDTTLSVSSTDVKDISKKLESDLESISKWLCNNKLFLNTDKTKVMLIGTNARLRSVNPNSIRSYKIVQKLSPKHAARGVAQSPYPIYRHRKACLSKQPPWRATGDPRLAHGRSWVRAPGPAGALRALFFLHPPFLPPSGDSFFFCTFPTKPVVRLGLIMVTFVLRLTIMYLKL